MEDSLIRLHAYVASDGIIDTWKSKDIHGKKLRIRKRFRVRFYNEEKKLIDDFIDSSKKIYRGDKYIQYSPKRMEVTVRGQIIAKAILSLGRVNSKDWQMPELSIRQSKIWVMAFADCDGTVGDYKFNRYVAIDSVNFKGLKQISYLLKKIKINNRIQRVNYHGKISYRLKVSGKDNLIKYAQIIGFNHAKKQEKLNKAINSYR